MGQPVKVGDRVRLTTATQVLSWKREKWHAPAGSVGVLKSITPDTWGGQVARVKLDIYPRMLAVVGLETLELELLHEPE